MYDIIIYVLIVFIFSLLVSGGDKSEFIQNNTFLDESLFENYATNSAGVLFTNTHIDTLVNCNDKTIECALNDPLSCSMCTNSMTSCVKIDKKTKIYDAHSDEHIADLEASEVGKGYCLRLAANSRRKCNENTGDLVLVRHQIGNIAHGYTFICKCKYPHLIGQKNIMSDCDVGNGCGEFGHLNSVTDNPMRGGRCICTNGKIADYDSHGAPICRNKKIIEMESNTPTAYTIPLDHPAIASEFKEQFVGNPKNIHIVNPCKLDAFSNAFINDAELESADTVKGTIWYCIPTASNIATVLYDTDYLTNNNGFYANGVYRISESTLHEEVQEWNTKNVEMYTRNGRYGGPVIGVITTKSELKKANPYLFHLLDSKFNEKVFFYSFINHIKVLPHTMRVPTRLHDYLEYNKGGKIPIKSFRLIVIDATVPSDDWIVSPRRCKSMLTGDGTDDEWPKMSFFRGTSDPEYELILKGGGFIGCIMTFDDWKLPGNMEERSHKELFMKVYDNNYILNGLNTQNTHTLYINHKDKTITNAWYGSKQLESYFTNNGVLFDISS